MVEKVEVVGYRIRWNDSSFRGAYTVSSNKCHRDDGSSHALMTVAQHERIVAGLEADKRRLDYLDSQREAYGFENEHLGNRWQIEGAYNSVRDAIDDEMRGPGDAFLAQTAEDKS